MKGKSQNIRITTTMITVITISQKTQQYFYFSHIQCKIRSAFQPQYLEEVPSTNWQLCFNWIMMEPVWLGYFRVCSLSALGFFLPWGINQTLHTWSSCVMAKQSHDATFMSSSGKTCYATTWMSSDIMGLRTLLTYGRQCVHQTNLLTNLKLGKLKWKKKKGK